MRENIYNILFDQYKNAPVINEHINRFVSFVNIEKLGVNPKTVYNTPLGIYSYPLEYVLDRTDTDKNKINVPFAGEAKFFYIFSVKGNIVNISNLKQNEYKKYINKLTTILTQYLSAYLKRNVVEDERDNPLILNQDFVDRCVFLKNIVNPYLQSKRLPKLSQNIVNKIFFNREIKDIIDKKNLKIKTVDNLLYVLLYYSIKKEKNADLLAPIIAKILINSFEFLSFYTMKPLKKLGGKFWFITLCIMRLFVFFKKYTLISSLVFFNNNAKFNPVLWTNLFLKLNIDGVVDYGDGIIHENEPVQAVFFRKNIIYNERLFINRAAGQHEETFGKTKNILYKFTNNEFVLEKYPGSQFFDFPIDYIEFKNYYDIVKFFDDNRAILGKIFYNLKNILIKYKKELIDFLKDKGFDKETIKLFIAEKLFKLLENDIRKNSYNKTVILLVVEHLKDNFIKNQLNILKSKNF